MKISVFGTGYVGLVTAVCLSKVGNNVYCVDINADKIEQLKKGICNFYEPDISKLIEDGITNKRLHFTTDAQMAVQHGDVLFVAVGTPELSNGDSDLNQVFNVANTIGECINSYKIVVVKSTVPVGTTADVTGFIQTRLNNRKLTVKFDVMFNPEFLKEGNAIADFSRPDRIILGTDSENVVNVMKNLYSPFNRNHDKIIIMDSRSAELTKYCANAMLAAKISLMNEMSNIADFEGADIELVRKGIGADKRIGYDFIYPGLGYGGSCFPKDISSLIHNAKKKNFTPFILEAIQTVNEQQGDKLVNKIMNFFNGNIKGVRLALWGLAFKAGTDDIRHSPSIKLLNSLLSLGASIKAYDPKALINSQALYDKNNAIQFCESLYDAVLDTDALIIATDWEEFRSPDFELIKQNVKYKVIFDGRNLYDPMFIKQIGLSYFCIGRRAVQLN